MIKINYMSTLFVSIDVSSKSNVVYAMDFNENKYIDASFSNNHSGADKLAEIIAQFMQKHSHLNTIIVALESTSVYSIHITNFFSSCKLLMPYKSYVYCLNPKMTANCRKSYVRIDKTDHMDAFLISDFTRVGRTKKCEPWRAASISAILTEFMSFQKIIDFPEEELFLFLTCKSRNRIIDISKTSELLKKAARDSYQLDKCMYEPSNVSLVSSFHRIQTYQKEIELNEQAVEECINGMNPNAFTVLKPIPSIEPVWANRRYNSIPLIRCTCKIRWLNMTEK